MAYHDTDFDQRIKRLSRRHAKMSRGCSTHVRPDGQLVAAPGRRRSRLSLRALLLFVVAFFLFKGFLVAAVGNVSYDARVERLAQGTLAERAGAWAMQSDPLSEILAQKMVHLQF